MDKNSARLIRLDERDNVLVALAPAGPGEVVTVQGSVLALPEVVAPGHKVAACDIPKGELVIKYGMPIGTATCDIAQGAHVHVHNIASRYTETHYRNEEAGFADD